MHADETSLFLSPVILKNLLHNISTYSLKFKILIFNHMMTHASKEVWDKPQIPPLEPPLVLFIAFTDRKCVLCTFNQIRKSAV